jgi:protein TonB
MEPAAAIGAARESRAPISKRQCWRLGFGTASILLHAAAIAGLVIVVAPPLAPAPLDQTPVELVFEQTEPATPPTPEAQPEAPPAAEAPSVPMRETPSPEPAPPPPELTPRPPPEPAPVPPEPIAPPEPEPPPPEPPPPPSKPLPTPPEPPKPPPPKQAPPMRPPPQRSVAKTLPEAPASRAEPSRAEPTPQTPTPAPAPAATMDPRWTEAVSGWLSSRSTYPEQARRRSEEGNVSVQFTVNRSGRVVEAAIVAPSGSALLDEAALNLVRQAVLPAFPVSMPRERVTLTKTFRYSLR